MEQIKEFSRSTDVQNAKELFNNLSEPNKVLFESAVSIIMSLLMSVQTVQEVKKHAV